jgi:hypothetical protein
MNKATGKTKLVRAKFGPGMLLQHQDLELLNSYTQNLSRLMFKSLFGCGVVCGLDVTPGIKCDKLVVTVNPGVAIACSGDPIWVPDTAEFYPSDDGGPGFGDNMWVVLCRTEKYCGPRPSVCDDEGVSVCTREVDGYEIRVEESRGCYCGCPEVATGGNPNPEPKAGSMRVSDCKCADPNSGCYKDHYDGTCACSCGECSDCDCDCILLAKLTKDGDKWKVDHSVRRFVRPVLMRDKKAEDEKISVVATKQEQDAAAQAEIERKQNVIALKNIKGQLQTTTEERDRFEIEMREMRKELEILRKADKTKPPANRGSKPAKITDSKA